jgi:superfamily II DNA helicase RecQ
MISPFAPISAKRTHDPGCGIWQSETDPQSLGWSFAVMIRCLERLKQSTVATKSTSISDLEYDTALFELLRKKRKELADAANMPPYIIFSRHHLIDMAAYFPQVRKVY